VLRSSRRRRGFRYRLSVGVPEQAFLTSMAGEADMPVDGNGVQRRFLWLLKNTLNPLSIRIARSGRGPFSLVRHVGRRSGRTYETPVILARVPQGFVAELTYGAGVSWYRNIVAAGGCVVVSGGAEYRIDRIEPCDPATGLRAFGNPAALVLRLLHRREFRLLHVGSPGGTAVAGKDPFT
jgi:deazaflavin-dependent oxidoreductase (nitroreductase family)